jgi:hypothetical protein
MVLSRGKISFVSRTLPQRSVYVALSQLGDALVGPGAVRPNRPGAYLGAMTAGLGQNELIKNETEAGVDKSNREDYFERTGDPPPFMEGASWPKRAS